MKFSNKLTNTLTVDVKSEEDKLLRINLQKQGINLVNVSFPEKLEKIDKNYIEKNWKNALKNDIENTVFIGNSKGKVIILFEDEDLQFTLLKLVEKLKLNALYTYVIDLGDKYLMQREIYKSGTLVLDNFDEEEERIKIAKFNFARCLR